MPSRVGVVIPMSYVVSIGGTNAVAEVEMAREYRRRHREGVDRYSNLANITCSWTSGPITVYRVYDEPVFVFRVACISLPCPNPLDRYTSTCRRTADASMST